MDEGGGAGPGQGTPQGGGPAQRRSDARWWVPLGAAGAALVVGGLFYVALARNQEPSTDPDVTGELLTDVSGRIADARADKAALQRIAGRLEVTGRTLREIEKLGKVDTDFDGIESGLKAIAEGAAPSGPQPPGAGPIDRTLWLYDANERKLVAGFSRLAPRYALTQPGDAATDDAALSEISFDLDSSLRAAAPQSLLGCRGSLAQDESPSAPVAATSRANACLTLLGELSDDWLGNTARSLAEQCEQSDADLDRRLAALDTDIANKERQAKELQRGLRSASALENLVRWGFPAMAGVVTVLFLIVRSFDLGLQRAIVRSRLLLDVITLLVLLTAILILGLSGKIESEVLGTLIGGITGYTLGRAALGDRAAGGESSEEKGGGDTTPAKES
jgi:hypothetical protein